MVGVAKTAKKRKQRSAAKQAHSGPRKGPASQQGDMILFAADTFNELLDDADGEPISDAEVQKLWQESLSPQTLPGMTIRIPPLTTSNPAPAAITTPTTPPVASFNTVIALVVGTRTLFVLLMIGSRPMPIASVRSPI